MNRKQRIIVSVTGIFLVLLILVGLTYAYFLTKINGNTNDKSISVTTANLELKYDDINDILISENAVEPGKSWVKTFSATNKGNKAVTYGVALENLINTLERTEDLVYTLECKQYLKNGYTVTDKVPSGTISGTCTGVEETEFPTLSSIIVQNTIDDDKVQAYTLTVTYKEANTNQSVDMGKQFSAKVNIVDPNTFGAYGTGTLASTIISSAKKGGENRTTWGSKVTEFTSISGENERVLNSAPDDYGISYYFRGNVLDNNVKFSTYNEDLYVGYYSEDTSKPSASYNSLSSCQNATKYNKKCTLINKKGDSIKWKIVRINGDGTVRLIFDGIAGYSEFNKDDSDNATMGYMYGLKGQIETKSQCIKLNSSGTKAIADSSIVTQNDCEEAGYKWTTTPYEATHVNVVSSTIKTNLEAWYKTNIVDTNNTDYIADTLFCNDKTIATNLKTIKKNSELGYGTNTTYYSFLERVSPEGTVSSDVKAYLVQPKFECAKGTNNTYSRFTSNSIETIKGVKVNNDLTYPIGLLSADEMIYSGANVNEINENYYLYNSDINSRTLLLTPSYYPGGGFDHGIGWYTYANKCVTTAGYTLSEYNIFQPTINIKSTVKVLGGDGTKENPYTLKLQ